MKLLIALWTAGMLTVCVVSLVAFGAAVAALISVHMLEHGRWPAWIVRLSS